MWFDDLPKLVQIGDQLAPGVGFERRTVSHYAAAAPARPGRLGRPHISRHGTTVKVTFGAARRATFRQVHEGRRVRVTVRGITAAERGGPGSVASKR